MIKAHMTEEEIMAEAKERFEESFNWEGSKVTLDDQIEFVRKMSKEEDYREEKALPLVDFYYQRFLTRDGDNHWMNQNAEVYYQRVLRNEIRINANEALRNFRKKYPYGEAPKDGLKKISEEEGMVRETAARLAYYKYMEEEGKEIRSGLIVNPEWESKMVSELESRTEEEIM